jgi:histidyl-tRNA synthetase
VLVASPGKGMQVERIRLASELWAANIAAEFGYKANPNFKDSLQQADDAGTPFVLVLGESELKEVTLPYPAIP